jgi:hypothetical protein
MTYFSLRKRQPEPEPDLVEEDLDETVDEPEDETSAEEAPADSTNPLVVGFLGPGNWIAARLGTGAAWGVHGFAAWAIGFYGGWVAIGVVLVWLLAALAFTPKEYLDQATAWIERRDVDYAPDEGELEPVDEGLADPRYALARWLLGTIGDRPGIHLRELYPAMRNLPGQEGRTDAELRALLKGFGVPVSRSVRIGRIAGRSGVYRHHVETLLPPTGERPGDSRGDAGQSADSPPLSEVGEGV